MVILKEKKKKKKEIRPLPLMGVTGPPWRRGGGMGDIVQTTFRK